MNIRLPQYSLNSQLVLSFTSLWLVFPDRNVLCLQYYYYFFFYKNYIQNVQVETKSTCTFAASDQQYLRPEERGKPSQACVIIVVVSPRLCRLNIKKFSQIHQHNTLSPVYLGENHEKTRCADSVTKTRVIDCHYTRK